MVNSLTKTNLSSSDFNNVLNALSKETSNGKSVEEVVKNVGYKEFETPILEYKNSLQDKITMLNSTVNEQLENNSWITPDTQELIKNSISKGQDLLKSLDQNSFNDLTSAKTAFEKIIKAQNIYLAQIGLVVDMMKNQVSKNLETIDQNTKNIKTRNEQILKLAKQSNDTLSFYLTKIDELNKTLTEFEQSNFDNLASQASNETIKGLIAQALEFNNSKKSLFDEFLQSSQANLKTLT
ncbi:hypothetical protein [Mycoplasma sp. 3686d]|uniref:hypothetical protein n=1 Tax=Mycoplasma sp. 3686d TaxID=2967300 RepID=UPI00211C409A|nr:hypothetical protein [Mycoplasma sp. 3686d]UUM24560.1 hypothetical protein NPA12_02560 [Mycoplasma sp. 3686d]